MTENKPFLLTETAALMRSRHSCIRLRQIAEECSVSITWLSKLQTDKLEDSPISKIQRVNTWLKSKIETVKTYR